MSKELQNIWTDRASSSAYFHKPPGHIFSEVLNPWLDLCVSVYKSNPLLLQLSMPGMWNVCISWFGRCQWGFSEGFDWLGKIIHNAKLCCDLFTQLLPINYKDEQVIFFNKGGWSGLRLVLFACSSLVFVSHGHLYFLNYYYYYCFLLDLDRWRTYGKMYRQKRTKTTSTITYLVLTRWYGVV